MIDGRTKVWATPHFSILITRKWLKETQRSGSFFGA